tara:strand:+ start:601 stop:2436 length:1836 start_codon:yes stop_codon:yes gene_type:complete
MGSSSTSWKTESNTHAGVSKVFSSSTWDAIVTSSGLRISGAETRPALMELWADEGDNNADKWKWQVADGGLMTWASLTSGSYATKLTLNTSGDVIPAGEIGVTATNKIYLDGDGGHTYIHESGDDILDFYVGTLNILKLDEANDKAEVLGADLEIDSNKKLYFDGGGDTYMSDNGSDLLTVTVGGAAMMNFDQDNSIINVGVDDTGYDVKLFGATSGKYWLWDESADGVVQIGTLTVGVDDTGHDVKFFGATSGRYMLWDESEDALKFPDSTGASFGTGDDLVISHNGTNSYISNSNGTLYIAALTSGIPVTIGHTTSVTTINDELDVTGTVDINDTTDASSTTTGALKVDGGVGIAKKLYVGTDLDVDGVTNLDAVDIDGTVQIDGSLSVGVNDTGYDVKFFGDTASRFWLWDTSADGVVQYGSLTVGVDDTGHDVKFFGATSGSHMLWDESQDKLILTNAYLEGAKLSYENVTANDTLTEAESGKLFIFNDADGAVLTLPDSGGGDLIGVTYHFYIAVTITSNSHKVVCTDTTNEKIHGQLHAIDVDGDASSNIWAAQAGDSFSAITTDGTTKAQIGSSFTITNIAADVWHINGNIHCAGTPATPFAAS